MLTKAYETRYHYVAIGMRRGDNRLITVSSSSRRRGCSMPGPDNEAMADNDRNAEVNSLDAQSEGMRALSSQRVQGMAN
jgi:hypothetical protein